MKISLPLLCGLALSQAVPPSIAQAPVPAEPPTAPPAVEAPAPVPTPPNKPGARGAATRSKRIENLNNDFPAGPGVAIAGAQDKLNQLLEMGTVLPRTAKTGRTLVIQSSNPDPTTLANAEEDLSVMALILRKATGARAEDRRYALGIEVDSTVFGSSSGARNIYLEGYGALFLLGVHFPLLPPPEKSSEKEPKDLANDPWAQAHEEYLTEGNAGPARLQLAFDAYNQVIRTGGRAPVEEYDAQKVEDLKTGLLQALKEASHIRALKPTDHVTVVIQGAETAHPDRPRGGTNTRAKTELRRGETVMTMRVSKADVDAFSKGTINLEAFRKKAAIQTYTRRADGSVGTAGFITPAPVR